MEALILKSFIFNGSGGNGAGVVILDDIQPDEEMLKIAEKVGLSETAFVRVLDDENFEVKFFTPVCEVDLCGHATIAAFYYVGEKLITDKSKTYAAFQHTKAGKLKIEIEFKENRVSKVLMEQAQPVFFGTVSNSEKIEIAKSLGIEPENIALNNFDLGIELVSTGLKDILIPVKSREILNNLKPDFKYISDISNRNNACGYHIYTLENDRVFARNMAPLVGIDEECATGTANGALGSLLHKKGIKSGAFSVLQGEAMNEMSEICVYVDDNEVNVGGTAIIV